MIPTGESFEFILEKDKLEKIRRVIAHNGGKIISEIFLDEDVSLMVRKIEQADS